MSAIASLAGKNAWTTSMAMLVPQPMTISSQPTSLRAKSSVAPDSNITTVNAKAAALNHDLA